MLSGPCEGLRNCFDLIENHFNVLKINSRQHFFKHLIGAFH